MISSHFDQLSIYYNKTSKWGCVIRNKIGYMHVILIKIRIIINLPGQTMMTQEAAILRTTFSHLSTFFISIRIQLPKKREISSQSNVVLFSGAPPPATH